MRIGLITNMMDTKTGGIGRYTYELVKQLLLLDKQNNYFLIHANNNKYDFKGSFQEITLPFFSTIPRKLITGAICFNKICHDYNLDILHDLGQIGPFYTKSNKKRILTVFDLTPILFPEKFSAYSNFYTKFYPLILKNTDKIITISNNTKKDLIKLYDIPENKIIITHLGIDKQFNKITNSQSLKNIKNKYNLPDNFILYVGTIEPRKNLENLIKAYIKLNYYDYKLVIVGKIGWKNKQFFTTLNKINIKKNIVLKGFVNDEDLHYFYNLAQLFVYPSFYEGFGLPVLEAMACGCPVITSNTSSLPEIVGNAGIMINPYSLENELIPAMRKILTDSGYKKKLIEKGLKQAEKFKWEKCAKKTLDLYQSLEYAK